MSGDLTPLERDLADVRYRMNGQSRANQVIAEMFAHATDLRRQGAWYAAAKTDAESRVGRVVWERREADPKEPLSAAEHWAACDESVRAARRAYRMAEQMVTADREMLRVLHAELDKLRTEAADRRAADSFTAREAT